MRTRSIEQPWRTLVKAHERVSFRDVSRLSDTHYGDVIRMSRGEIATTPAVRDALAKLFNVPPDQLDEWAELRVGALWDGAR